MYAYLAGEGQLEGLKGRTPDSDPDGTAMFVLRGVKLFADGALGSRGAALTHPYADDSSTTGVARLTSGEIAAWSRRAIGAGLGVATHAIGDEAVKRTLDAYQTVLGELRDLPPGTLRIEHFSYAREEDFARAVGLGITLSIQSNFNSGAEDAPTFGGMRGGDANEPWVYTWRRLFEMQARLSEGSDYFARPGEPLDGFLAAMTRRNTVGDGHDDPTGKSPRPLSGRSRLTAHGSCWVRRAAWAEQANGRRRR